MKILLTARHHQTRFNGGILPFLLLLGVLHHPLSVSAGEGDAIIQQVRKAFRELTTLTAQFEVRYGVAGVDTMSREAGRFFMSDSGRFRMETPRQTIACDGQTIWMYNPLENQVIIRSVAGGVNDLITPKRLLYDYPELYTVIQVDHDQISGHPCDVLVMKPKSETDPTRQVKVWVDRQSHLTRKFFVEDLADNVTVFEFKNFQPGVDLPDDIFQFSPPQGTEIIDLR